MSIFKYQVRSLAVSAAKGETSATASFCVAELHGWRKSFDEWLKLVEQFRSAMLPETNGGKL